MKWKLTDLAESEIDALARDGIAPTPQEVLTMQEFSLEACGELDDSILAYGDPSTIGGLVFWPLTIGAADWYAGMNELTDDDDLRLFCLAFAMVNSHDPAALVRGYAGLKAVKAWARRLPLRVEDLVLAVNDVLGDRHAVGKDAEDAEDAEDGGRSSGAKLAEIATAMWGSPDVWEWQASIQYVANVISRHYALEAGRHDTRTGDGLRKLAIFVDGIRERAGKR